LDYEAIPWQKRVKLHSLFVHRFINNCLKSLLFIRLLAAEVKGAMYYVDSVDGNDARLGHKFRLTNPG
jgi:hypothetical protein